MYRRWVRVSLVLIVLATTGGAVYDLFNTQQRIESERDVEQAFVASTFVLAGALTDLRAAQQAYVAAGQDPGYWVEKVSAERNDLLLGLNNLSTLSTTVATVTALDEARSQLGRLDRVDQLAREHTAAEQALMASDLIFTDGLQLATETIRQLELARMAEQTAHTERREQLRKRQTLALAGLLAAGLIAVLMLTPVRPVAGAVQEDGTVSEVTTVAQASEPDPVDEPAITVASPLHEELQRAAALCTDLGRLRSPDQLPPLLERAAELLHASGVIVWVRDSSGTGLRPAVAHGYAGETLARLGRVPCSSDNAAAAAYRSRELQVVPITGDAKGALVVPLLGPDECIGVMSAELKAGWEGSADVQATASILAAQFATVITADAGAQRDVDAERAQG